MPPRNSAPTTESALMLLVNRSANGRTARKAVLEELGHRVTVSASAADALEQCSKQVFQLIVTDVDLMTRLRKQTPEVPIIFISDVVDPLGLNEENTGADAVIQKSAHEVAHLVRAVNRLLRKKPARKPATGERSVLKVRAKTV